MKNYIRSIALLLIILPVLASAQNVDQLRAQIEQLLAQINALQQTGGVMQPPATVVPPIPPASVQCPHVSRSLKLGASGDDVARLQRFLAQDPSVYPEAMVSGYYGALTEAAVKRFQCKNKIVCEGTPDSTGYGVTGPRTAALMALQCSEGGGSGADVGGFIKVTPVTGAAPLQVTIEATVNTTRSCTGATYELDFGDGTSPVSIPVPNGVCAETRQIFNHVYAGGGTFNITLRSGVHRTNATVVVSGAPIGTGSGGESFSANATTGAAPFTITFSGIVNPRGECNAGPYRIFFGDGETVTLPITGCTASSYNVTHTYANPGNISAQLTRGNPSVIVGSISISITGTGGSGSSVTYFAVSPSLDGDGTVVKAQFEIGSPCAAFDLDWGDGSSHITQAQGSCAGTTTSKEYTHDYANAGSYNIVLKRGAGLTTTDTASITISQ